MRLFYASPGLINNAGHFANHCRVVRAELQKRGIETIILASARVDDSLQAELDAIPFFATFPNWRTDGDPVCGWLNIFDRTTAAVTEDFRRLFDIAADDVVYINALWPAQVMGLWSWWTALDQENAPSAIVELAASAAVAVRKDGAGLSLGFPDPRTESRPALYRFVAQKIASANHDRIKFVTGDTTRTAIYASLTGLDVRTVPSQMEAIAPHRSRAGQSFRSVAFLGGQRTEKGFDLVPAIVEQLLHQQSAIRILVHNASPDRIPDPQRKLRVIAKRDPRLMLYEHAADMDTWRRLLDESDVIVCPYDPHHYTAGDSGVVAEAIAHGIPVVVPAGTTLSALLGEVGGAGVTFESQTVAAICHATASAIQRYDDLALVAVRGAEKWRSVHGVSRYVDAILALAQAS